MAFKNGFRGIISAMVLRTTGICSDGHVKPQRVSAGDAIDINDWVAFSGAGLRMLKSVPSMQQLHTKRNAVKSSVQGWAGGDTLK